MKKDCWTVLWYFSITVEFGTWRTYLKLCIERDAIAHQRGTWKSYLKLCKERDAIAHQRGERDAIAHQRGCKIARTNF